MKGQLLWMVSLMHDWSCDCSSASRLTGHAVFKIKRQVKTYTWNKADMLYSACIWLRIGMMAVCPLLLNLLAMLGPGANPYQAATLSKAPFPGAAS